MKKIVVATGTSENKKKFAVNFIQDYFNKKGIDVQVEGANIYEMKPEDSNPDLIVTIGPGSFNTAVPIIQGTAFITKMGMEKCCDLMIEKLS